MHSSSDVAFACIPFSLFINCNIFSKHVVWDFILEHTLLLRNAAWFICLFLNSLTQHKPSGRKIYLITAHQSFLVKKFRKLVCPTEKEILYKDWIFQGNLNCKIYSSKIQNVFVHIAKYICSKLIFQLRKRFFPRLAHSGWFRMQRSCAYSDETNSISQRNLNPEKNKSHFKT